MAMKWLDKQDEASLLRWWHWLDDNRGERAQLRRAQAPDDVLLTPAFAHFLQHMPSRWSENSKILLTDAAMVAAVLSRVRQYEEKNSFAKSLALPGKSGSKSLMSELRFQKLQKSRTTEEFFRQMCRAIDLLGKRVNIVSLADDILHWLTERRYGPASKPVDRLAVRWATDYYANCKE